MVDWSVAQVAGLGLGVWVVGLCLWVWGRWVGVDQSWCMPVGWGLVGLGRSGPSCGLCCPMLAHLRAMFGHLGAMLAHLRARLAHLGAMGRSQWLVMGQRACCGPGFFFGVQRLCISIGGRWCVATGCDKGAEMQRAQNTVKRGSFQARFASW